MKVKDIIEKAWADRSLLANEDTIAAIRTVIEELDKGRLRTAEPLPTGEWQVNEWVKKAVLMYFPIQKMKVQEVGIFRIQ